MESILGCYCFLTKKELVDIFNEPEDDDWH